MLLSISLNYAQLRRTHMPNIINAILQAQTEMLLLSTATEFSRYITAEQ